jgi:hypothetical protein
VIKGSSAPEEEEEDLAFSTPKPAHKPHKFVVSFIHQ